MTPDTQLYHEGTLKFIATALLQQHSFSKQKLDLPVTQLNENFRYGWERLSLSYFYLGMIPPRTLHELIKLLHAPVNLWPVFSETMVQHKEPLLIDGQPSGVCYELGEALSIEKSPHLAMQNEQFKKLHELCKQRADAALYTMMRTFLVRNPVLEDALTALQDAELAGLGTLTRAIADCYEAVPVGAQRGGQIALCPHCGWALNWHRDEARCHQDGICDMLVGELSDTDVRQPYRNGMKRTIEGIQRYVVAPEIELMRIYDRLTQMRGVKCELYPNFDAFDLMIYLPTGLRVAIDLKDWKNPVELAGLINHRPFAYGPVWDRAFYVFPDYRADAPYLNRIKNYWSNRNEKVACIRASEFLIWIKKEIDQ